VPLVRNLALPDHLRSREILRAFAFAMTDSRERFLEFCPKNAKRVNPKLDLYFNIKPTA